MRIEMYCYKVRDLIIDNRDVLLQSADLIIDNRDVLLQSAGFNY